MPAALCRLGFALLIAGAMPALAQEGEGGFARLPQMAPALVACLQAAPGSAATAALPMNHGRALVRLERPDGERRECVAELGPAGRPARVESDRPVGAAPPLPGEGERRFTLRPLCGGAAAVRDEAGTAAGWLNPSACR
ncbi:hypothetical protein [Teichococcus aestuarii]|uniref:hypothetical protein n=1 Tax=Teichococcus aestuarii TaxID=568898 RepID=UPI003612C433